MSIGISMYDIAKWRVWDTENGWHLVIELMRWADNKNKLMRNENKNVNVNEKWEWVNELVCCSVWNTENGCSPRDWCDENPRDSSLTRGTCGELSGNTVNSYRNMRNIRSFYREMRNRKCTYRKIHDRKYAYHKMWDRKCSCRERWDIKYERTS